ncbi:MAG: A/G-specific adenine glycosylase [Bacteroidales bacterium]
MKFSKKIIRWYRDNKRELPWRKTTDPYKIWLSEIILQQTRIDQGTNYYLRFITQYPDRESLANASEEEILKLWQGLGYYSRARNLHKTAKAISQDLNGVFPNTYEDLVKHKGIGEYTAAAIASIAFGVSKPVVDGNVLRFLARFHGVSLPINSSEGKNEIKKLVEELIDQEQPGDFNQAIMEFGALVCKPQNPDCKSCIFKHECIALTEDKVKSFR